MTVNGGKRRGSTQTKKNFEDLSRRQKNRRAEDVSASEVDELLLAAAKAAKRSNLIDLEYILKLMYKDKGKATKIRSLLKAEESMLKPKKIDPLVALTFLLDNNFTLAQYTNTRLISKQHESNIFPSYKKVAETKKECRPSLKCNVNDVSATLPLQELLNHTAYRLLLLQEPVFSRFNDEKINDVTVKLQIKWGSDGSGDHSQYNQKYVNVELTKKSDANFFATTLVPLRMTTEDSRKIVVWNNPAPQSPRWCRPLRLHFAKETDDFVLQEKDVIEAEITALNSFQATIAGVRITVVYELYMTMINEKTLATVTRTKSKQTCCICKATPKEFNKLHNIKTRFRPKEGTLKYGLSVLHLWIRSFEWLLHVSYRLNLGEKPKWQLRGPDLKAKAKIRKQALQTSFLELMNIRVDFPSTGGSGNTNNGNVCRKAFSNPKLLSEILDINERLIIKIRVILIALSCQLPLDIERFDEFCKETARQYVVEYKWFPFPASIHKALFHARDIMLANDLTVGVLAEDASESCNKLYRQNREFHARKNSRQNNLEDVFNRALDSSDPIIASYGSRKRQNARIRKNIPQEVLNLLKTPDEPPINEQAELEHELEETDNLDITEADPMEDGISEAFAATLDEFNLSEDEEYDEEYDDEEYDEEEYDEEEYDEEEYDEEDDEELDYEELDDEELDDEVLDDEVLDDEELDDDEHSNGDGEDDDEEHYDV